MAYTVAIIGLGKIGMLYDRQLPVADYVLSHARAFHLHPDFELVGAVDPDSTLRDDFSATYQARAYGSLNELLTDFRPEVMVVASPTPTHGEVISRILAHYTPKVIFCEKPLAYESSAAQTMIDACAHHKVPLYVNFIRRADPGVREIKSRIETGEIAMPFKAVVWYSKGLLHNGSHFADLLAYWFGPIRAGTIINPGRTLSDHDAEPDFNLQFDQGSAIFCAAEEEYFSHYTAEIVAANGRLRYEQGGAIAWQPAIPHPQLTGYRQLQAFPASIENDMNRYQYRAAAQLSCALNEKRHALCTAEGALETQRWLENLIKERNTYG